MPRALPASLMWCSQASVITLPLNDASSPYQEAEARDQHQRRVRARVQRAVDSLSRSRAALRASRAVRGTLTG